MIEAILKGKLSRGQENMEDILTSSVFGLLRILPPPDGILPFLRAARTLEGTLPLKDVGDNATVDCEFWPWLDSDGCYPCEPDLLVRIREPHVEPRTVLIEAKFHSGKSSEEGPDEAPPNDQLAREWDNLVCLASSEQSKPLLLYLTADFSPPRAGIEASMLEYRRKRGASARFDCAWLSWRDLSHSLAGCQHPIALSLRQLMDRFGLHRFRGITQIAPIHGTSYAFAASPPGASWKCECIPIHWRFVA